MIAYRGRKDMLSKALGASQPSGVMLVESPAVKSFLKAEIGIE